MSKLSKHIKYTFVDFEQVKTANYNPAGTIIWSAGANVPTGYLLCNGSAVSREEYPDLFEVIGTTYGQGDGSTTFNLPNLIGKFVEGANTAGVEHEAGLPNITGGFDSSSAYYQGYDDGSYLGAFQERGRRNKVTLADGTSSGPYTSGFTFDASRSSAIYGNSDTVQPPSVTALPCIKAYNEISVSGSIIGGGKGKTNSIYSTDELEVGTWIDGSTIYRKVIHCNTPSNTTNDFIVADLSDLNINKLVSLSSVIHCSNIDYPISSLFINDSQYVSLSYSHLTNKVRQHIKYNRMLNVPQDITIEYTKSDSSSSSINKITLPSGRKIYRHPSDQGSVIECTMHGMPLSLFVADAQYRTTKSFIKKSSGSCVNSRTGTRFYPNTNTTLPQNMQTLDDAWMDANVYYFDGTAACDYGNNQTELVITSEAAQYTRSLKLLDNNGLDIPNIWEIFMMMSEGDYIDELDPSITVGSSTMSLGYNVGTGKRFCNGSKFGSCDAGNTSKNYSYIAYTTNDTNSSMERTTGNGVVLPIRELNLF